MNQNKASFAAGCFWGVEAKFRELEGVMDAVVGYMGGDSENPSYPQVCSGLTGHTETVQLVYDEPQISYRELLDTFFTMHNPTTLNRQGPDHGSQYRSVIFWHDQEQCDEANQKIDEVNASGVWSNPVVTEITEAGQFWPAEEYHQRYFEKNGAGFCKV